MAELDHRSVAGNRAYKERIQELAGQLHQGLRYHSIELPDGTVLPGLQPIEHLRHRLDLFELPDDLRGKRVLDIGAWDGWFSFECERRGADVVAVDCVELDTFLIARRLLDSKVEYVTLDVNELSAKRLGRFDIVLFFGVLYHLRHPLLGLEKVVELSTDLALIESFVLSSEARAIPSVMEFYERAELGGQIDNWCGPSPECLMAMCRSAGFAQVELKEVSDQRASVLCHRRWPEPDVSPLECTPQLLSVVNNRTYGAKFHPHKDEYLCCYFKNAESGLTVDSLFVEVDGFGTQALVVVEQAGAFQANCLRPPGLDPGRHEVRIRTRHSARSNAAEFTMLDENGCEIDVAQAALPLDAPEICSVEFRRSGDVRFAASRSGALVCYFRSPAKSISASDVVIEIDSGVRQAHSVSFLGDGVWQANVLLETPLAEGCAIRVRLGNGPWSA